MNTKNAEKHDAERTESESVQKVENGHTFDSENLPDMLKIYYKRLFPHKNFYRWLSYFSCKYTRTAKAECT